MIHSPALLLALFLAIQSTTSSVSPVFLNEMANITVATGREAVFTCVVYDTDVLKVAFLRVDTQTILTIDDAVITRSNRISVRHSTDRLDNASSSDSDKLRRKTWQMTLREVTQADAGAYMCQLNIEPMISQVAYLHVTVPPDILVNKSSSDLTLVEGQSAILRCSATGFPEPNITWRREDYLPIYPNQSKDSLTVEGSTLHLSRVHRQQMAAYLCIASNGVPPSVSKRILVRIEFSPEVTTEQTEVQQRLGEQLTLYCQCRSWPPGLTHWTYQTDRLPTEKAAVNFHSQMEGQVTNMRLTIAEMLPQDQGIYTCHCSNNRGSSNQTITVSGLALNLHRRMEQHRDPNSEEVYDDDDDEEMPTSEPPFPAKIMPRTTTTSTTSAAPRTTTRRVAPVWTNSTLPSLRTSPRKSRSGPPISLHLFLHISSVFCVFYHRTA